MRSVMIDGIFRQDLPIGAIFVNCIYLCFGALIFAWSFVGARKTGKLLQMGE
jgi:23S rRNA A1618 N6-methylase RlmF